MRSSAVNITSTVDLDGSTIGEGEEGEGGGGGDINFSQYTVIIVVNSAALRPPKTYKEFTQMLYGVWCCGVWLCPT